MKGKSKKTISKNISEFHKGKTYEATKAKFGEKKANAQAIAVALETARKSARKKHKRGYTAKAVESARSKV